MGAPFTCVLCVASQFEAGEHKEGKDISRGQGKGVRGHRDQVLLRQGGPFLSFLCEEAGATGGRSRWTGCVPLCLKRISWGVGGAIEIDPETWIHSVPPTYDDVNY